MSMAQVLKLKPAFSDEQAEALAGLFDEEAATKRDVATLAADVEKLRIEVSADIERVRAELRTGLESVRAELKAEIDKLRLEVQRDLRATEARLVTWVVGQGAATIGILFTLQHFFGK